MRKLIFILLCIFLVNCSSQLKLGKYENICYSTDAPSNILSLKKNNVFVLTYPSSIERLSGIWMIKKDTLFLSSQYQSSLKGSDSIAYVEEKKFILKRKKLINPLNEKCYLVLKNKTNSSQK
ncbi:hypothetical protein [Chryseobacterium phocaeense]|uniref:hypothetical protein n=1 Tax=Chryseobacterium phocaeense TaxID=1816690 RepID=UPI001117CE40|nr:hypothetical protein [Chryseobacterium phocaeense]